MIMIDRFESIVCYQQIPNQTISILSHAAFITTYVTLKVGSEFFS